MQAPARKSETRRLWREHEHPKNRKTERPKEGKVDAPSALAIIGRFRVFGLWVFMMLIAIRVPVFITFRRQP